MKRAKGFSLIELLIVVAIILIIAGIGIPNYMRSRMSANEAAAVASLRNISTGSVVYSSTYGNGYPPSLLTLGPPPGNPSGANCDHANLIDDVVANGLKSGFLFTYAMANPNATKPGGCSNAGGNSYFITAIPQAVGQTGQRSFCSDQSGVIRFDPTGNGIDSDAACLALTALQ
jgi:prepilin-type N-terminal cleavage/methylation domain-containing protein